MPIIFLIDCPLVWDTGIYRFDMNRRCIIRPYNQLILMRFVRRFILNLYIAVSHTNRRSTKNTIGVAVNCLVGMGLSVCLPKYSQAAILHAAHFRGVGKGWEHIDKVANMIHWTQQDNTWSHTGTYLYKRKVDTALCSQQGVASIIGFRQVDHFPTTQSHNPSENCVHCQLSIPYFHCT